MDREYILLYPLKVGHSSPLLLGLNAVVFKYIAEHNYEEEDSSCLMTVYFGENKVAWQSFKPFYKNV